MILTYIDETLMLLHPLVLTLLIGALLSGCGGGISSPSIVTSSLSLPTTTGPNLTSFYGTYNVKFVKVRDTGCDVWFADEGTIELSGNLDGSNLSIVVFEPTGYLEREMGDVGTMFRPVFTVLKRPSAWLVPRTYLGSIDAAGRFQGSGLMEFVSLLNAGVVRRHKLQGGIVGEVKQPPSDISGKESLLFRAGILASGSRGCPEKEVELTFTGRP